MQHKQTSGPELSGSCTVGHQLWLKNLGMIGSH
jgi:hypothetical protein